jgi:hypothetical protein
MISWSTGRFRVNKDQLATPTDRLLVCGVKKARIARGSAMTLDTPLTEQITVPALVRTDRPSAKLGTFVFMVGAALGFAIVMTWPLMT